MNIYLGQRFRHLRIPCNFSQSTIFLPDCLCVQRTAHPYSLIRTFSGHTGGRKESKGPLGGERRLYLARAGVQDGLESSLGKHSLYSRKCCVLTHMLLFLQKSLEHAQQYETMDSAYVYTIVMMTVIVPVVKNVVKMNAAAKFVSSDGNYHIWAATSENVSLNMCKRCEFTSTCTCAKSHPDICLPSKRSILAKDSFC